LDLDHGCTPSLSPHFQTSCVGVLGVGVALSWPQGLNRRISARRCITPQFPQPGNELTTSQRQWEALEAGRPGFRPHPYVRRHCRLGGAWLCLNNSPTWNSEFVKCRPSPDETNPNGQLHAVCDGLIFKTWAGKIRRRGSFCLSVACKVHNACVREVFFAFPTLRTRHHRNRADEPTLVPCNACSRRPG
jgi:hypothetical protein